MQATFDDLGTPLSEVEFVVVDLETTGGSPGAKGITEIGAVKVRGGEVLGEFATLVNPGVPIPPMITVITGITTAMVLEAPAIEDVLPSFLEWSGLDRGAVMVAHNARYDAGFLRAACADLNFEWPRPAVVDTLALARRVVTRDETPDYKLGTLSQLFRTSVSPEHRALADAQATADLLHGLLERLAPLGVSHLEDLASAADPVPAARRKKSKLAADVPRGPGVYMFIGPAAEVLYVGTATDLRSRVRSYFTAAETRRRIGEMVDLAKEVHTVPCGSVIEARVRELRLIDQFQPPFNRRSRAASARPWLRLTDEPHPRLSVVRSLPVANIDTAWGPFASGRQATLASEALAEASGIRTCNQRLPRTPRDGARACALFDMAACTAPCVSADSQHDLPVVAASRGLAGGVSTVVQLLQQRMENHAAAERFEEAAYMRDQLRAVLDGAQRAERLRAIALQPEIVAARPSDRGWELIVVRWGRLAAAGILEATADAWESVRRLQASAEHVPEPTGMGEAATVEETELLAAWLNSPGARLIELAESTRALAFEVGSANSYPLPPSRLSLEQPWDKA